MSHPKFGRLAPLHLWHPVPDAPASRFVSIAPPFISASKGCLALLNLAVSRLPKGPRQQSKEKLLSFLVWPQPTGLPRLPLPKSARGSTPSRNEDTYHTLIRHVARRTVRYTASRVARFSYIASGSSVVSATVMCVSRKTRSGDSPSGCADLRSKRSGVCL